MSISNVSLSIPEIGITTRCTVDPAKSYVPYNIIGASTQTKFTNKDILDLSNSVAAQYLTVNGAQSKIIGTATTGQVLTYTPSGLEFITATGSGPKFAIKYVSSVAPPGGDGSITEPFNTIGAAIIATASNPDMKAICVLPGLYIEDIKIYPNTVLFGLGASSVQHSGSLFTYDPSVTNYTGSVYVKDMSIGQLTLDSSSVTGAIIDYTFENITTQSVSIVSNATSTSTVILRESRITGNLGLQTINTCNVQNMTIGGFTTAIISSSLVAKSCIFAGLSVTGTLSAPTVSITESHTGQCIFYGNMSLTRDAPSMFVSSRDPGVMQAAVYDGSFTQITDNTVVVGDGAVNAFNLSNCTSVGANVAGLNAGSIGRTALGYGATVIADNQVAFSDAAQSLKAAGLVGHASTTALTYNPATGVISFLSSSRANKTNIRSLSNDISGKLVDSLSPCEYTWKTTGSSAVGLIAEEVSDVCKLLSDTCPGINDLVTMASNKKDIIGVNYLSMIPHLINTIQDLRQRIAKIEASIAK